jgi:hypothetical protein
LRIFQDVIVPESQHTKSFSPQIGVTHFVPSILCVLPAIDLNDQLSPEARKVDHIRSDWHLPLEFVSAEAVSAQPVPQPTLGVGHVAA